MIVWHTGDLHIKAGSRFDECRRVLNHIADRVEQDGPDAVVVAGDIFDAKSQPVEMQYAELWVQRIANVCPVVMVRGNHDAQHEIESFSRLKATNSIVAVERPTLVTFDSFVRGPLPITIACMPWPTKAGVVLDSAALSLEQAGDDATDRLRAILRWLGDELDKRKGPSIFLGHAMVRGSMTAAGQPLTGCDFELGLDDLALVHADAYALGHIHKSQAWQAHDAIFRYSGSPFHTDFGDWFEKSFTRWEFNAAGLVGCSTVELPAHQMLEIKANYIDDVTMGWGLHMDDANWPPSAEDGTNMEQVEFKLTYSHLPEHAAAARHAAQEWRKQQLAAGAYSVDLNPQTIVSTRARAPEVATASTPEDKLRAHWRSKGEDPDDELHRRLLDKFREVSS
jgi:exonuclease SbcD